MEQNNKDKETVDVSQILKESETEAKFPERQFSAYSLQPKIIQWLIKYSGGLIRSPRQASYLIFGFIIMMILISIFLFYTLEKSTIPPKTLEQPEYGLPIID